MHLAELDVGRLRAPAGAPRVAEFILPAGHRPDLAEATDRLDHLRRYGDSDHAFGWKHLHAAQLYKTKVCAAG